MTFHCRLCGKETAMDRAAAAADITHGICAACAQLSGAGNGELLEAIAAPILLMQGNPRQVVIANRRALALFGKEPAAVEAHRGGQVFDCVHSFTEAGCGKDLNCENCTIKNAIVDTFTTGSPQQGVAATLQLRKAGGIESRVVQISTEKIGELALVRVERYDRCDEA